MPKRQLDAVGSILEALTGVLEVEYLKKQRNTSNEYDTVVSQLEKMVNIAKEGKVSKGGGMKIMKKKRDHTIHGL